LGVIVGTMVKNNQFDILNKNYDELENDKKDTLLKIGENLLNIQSLINNEKFQEIKSETKNKKSDVNN
jgi:hypothetical protein